MPRPTAVVTGASSGIGAATAERLAAEGYDVLAAARRSDRLDALARRSPVRTHLLDVTDAASVEALAEAVEECAVLVNNAGGALGLETVAQAAVTDWQHMYEVNVLGTLRVTQALLPALSHSGNGTVVLLSSTAATEPYEGGGGYSVAKHGQHALARTLRLELCGEPVRVVEVAPGMVRTEEFSLNRFRGDAERAAGVYQGVEEPLVAADVADTIAWAVTRPPHVNLDLLVVRPRAQAAAHRIHRRA